MKIFDAALYADQRPDEDLDNLAWFDVERALALAHAPRPFETAEELWRYLEQLIVSESARLEQHGLGAHVAVAVQPGAVPQRAHEELWLELPWLLRDPRVLALGALRAPDPQDPQAWRLIERQLEIMERHQIHKPVLFALPPRGDTRLRLAVLQRLAQALEAHHQSPGACLVLGADLLVMDALEALGMHAGLLRNPQELSAREVLQIAQHHDRRRLILGSGMGSGPADVLALPKLAVTLSEAGIPAMDIERMLYGNAMALLVRAQRSA